jgi:hypothetical protein
MPHLALIAVQIMFGTWPHLRQDYVEVDVEYQPATRSLRVTHFSIRSEKTRLLSNLWPR